MKLANKVAVVTGGSSGIGAEVVFALASEGARVAVVASQSAEKSARVVERVRQAGGEARAFAADVRDPSAVEQLFAAVDAAYGGVDILVNAAGVYYPTPIEGTAVADVDRMIDINLKGAWHAISAAVPRLKARGGGKIVNFSSVASRFGLGGFGLYCATKAAIVLMTRSLACELAPYNINVNAIAPGNTATPMNEAFRADPASKPYLDAMARATPSNTTFSSPEEIAAAVMFIVTQARAMHGSTLVIDEGISAGLML
jgi:3-oxoacyl-[acyl-carrier protein] reductase